MSQIEIYQTKDNQTQIEVKFEGDTVWLTQKQIALLFGTQVPAINKHIKNIVHSKELDENLTISKMEMVRNEGKRKVVRTVDVFNLDMVISIGYRVNSSRATQFRMWATNILKKYLTDGYTMNEKRLSQLYGNLNELKKAVELIENSSKKSLSYSETKGLLNVLTNYTQSFVLLNQYDSKTLENTGLNENVTYEINYKEAVKAIKELKESLIKKKEASDLFGNQKDKSFEGILKSIIQTFGGKYLYPTIEEQASHLLYFVIKNHPFSDGNKRIGAFLFIWFLEKNKHRFKKSGELKINDNALTAIALLVAQSNPNDKEMMIKLIVNLIKG